MIAHSIDLFLDHEATIAMTAPILMPLPTEYAVVDV